MTKYELLNIFITNLKQLSMNSYRKLTKYIQFISIVLCLQYTTAFAAKTFNAEVIYVYDGDSFKAKVNNLCMHNKACLKTVQVRLAQIDAPEYQQPYGEQAKNALRQLIKHQTVKMVVKTVDKYNRLIAYVYINGQCVNYTMVELGHAWRYLYFSDDPKIYQLEQNARLKQIGLWQNLNTIPPWIWRQQHRN